MGALFVGWIINSTEFGGLHRQECARAGRTIENGGLSPPVHTAYPRTKKQKQDDFLGKTSFPVL